MKRAPGSDVGVGVDVVCQGIRDLGNDASSREISIDLDLSVGIQELLIYQVLEVELDGCFWCSGPGS